MLLAVVDGMKAALTRRYYLDTLYDRVDLTTHSLDWSSASSKLTTASVLHTAMLQEELLRADTSMLQTRNDIEGKAQWEGPLQ